MAKKIRLEGYVGDDLTPEGVSAIFDNLSGEDIEADLYSYGGVIYPGVEIHNRIKSYPGTTTVTIGAIAASAATYIALAFDNVIVHDYSAFMIHNAESIIRGDSNTMQKEAEELKKLNNMIANFYAKKTGKEIKEILKMMNDETTLYGQEIVDFGFADKIIDDGNQEPLTKENIINFMNNANDKFMRKVAALKNPSTGDGLEIKQKGNLSTMKKDEILEKLNTLRQNSDVTLPEIAKCLGLENQLLTKNDKEAREIVSRLNDLGFDDIEKEIIELKAKAEEGVKAKLETELLTNFGPKTNEDGTPNPIRLYAETRYTGPESLKNLFNDPVMKQLKSASADYRSPENQINQLEPGINTGGSNTRQTVKY